ncbi:MAG: hypothetical protein Q7V63_02535 [Gammaproteobacteria bacterium]|nr:hypothetical protein [Gammaproteobacteria bacterium]
MFGSTIASVILLAIVNTWVWPFADHQKIKHSQFQLLRYRKLIQGQLISLALQDTPNPTSEFILFTRTELNKMRQYVKELGALNLQHDDVKPKLIALHQAWWRYYCLLSSISLAAQTLVIPLELKTR